MQAGHAARVERVSDEKLYYLRSRGIPKDDATVMMIESSIRSLFEELAQFDQDQYETCVQTLLSQTLQRETTA